MSVERYHPEQSRRVQRRIAARVAAERFAQAVESDWQRHDYQMTDQAITYDMKLIDRK